MDNKLKFKIDNLFLLLAAAAIPCVLLLICLVYVEAVPFGDYSLVFRDARGQYLDFLSYMKTVFAGENDLLYSFSKSMGGDFLSLAAYYLLSPFNVLFLLASDGAMPAMFSVVAILKLACCGMCFYYASSRIYGARPVLLAFSSAYALIGYNVLYIWNLMWLDGVIVLPLVVLGIYRIWTENRYSLYVISLVYALLSNYYIGYMLCVASVIFSVALMLIKDGGAAEKAKRFGKYLLASGIAGFAAAPVWLPSFVALLGDRADFNMTGLEFETNFCMADLFSKFVAGAASGAEMAGGLPHIFCTIAVLLLVLLFFMNKDIPGKKRLAAAVCVLLLCLSFYINLINVFWHGMSGPNGFPYRYSFVFSFMLIMIAQHQLLQSGKTPKRNIAAAAVIIAAMLIFVYYKGYDYISNKGMAISVLCLVAGATAVFASGSGAKRLACLLMAAICIGEAGVNCALSLKELTNSAEPLRAYGYFQSVETSRDSVDFVKELDEGFYRMEKTFGRSHNDAMFYAYNGITHFSSADKSYVIEFLGKMGLRDNDIWAYYNQGSTAEAESLLGIKYLIGSDSGKGFELIETVGGNNVYYNPDALPMAYAASRDIVDVSMEQEDLFALHNEIWTGIAGHNCDVLLPEQEYSVVLNNVSEENNEEGYTLFRKLDPEQPASVCYRVEISEEMPLYYYFTAPLVQVANTAVNGTDKGQYFWIYSWNMVNAGTYKPGETVDIEIVLRTDELILEQEYFYYEDLEALEAVSGEIKERPVELTMDSSSRLSGSCELDKDELLLFSIPHSEGWRLEVDGKKTDTFMVMDTLMAAELPEGAHSFELRYVPAGMNAGLCMAVLAILTALAWFLLDRKNRR